MSYFHCGNGYPDRCNGYKGPLDASVCTSGRHTYDERGRQVSDPTPQSPYCGQCEWDGTRLVSRCFLCARDRKASTTHRGHGASEGDPSL